jgi:hypothetical protein
MYNTSISIFHHDIQESAYGPSVFVLLPLLTNAFPSTFPSKAVYQIPVDYNDTAPITPTSALQHIFHAMETSDTAICASSITFVFISTSSKTSTYVIAPHNLIKAFGRQHSFASQDVVEFRKVLLDRLEQQAKVPLGFNFPEDRKLTSNLRRELSLTVYCEACSWGM